jgi:V8-like Glu-specific endopeptidase
MGTQTPVMLLIPLLASLTGIPAGGAPADPVSHGVKVITHEVSLDPARKEQILHYWTMDRMVHAIAPARPVHPAKPHARQGARHHRSPLPARRPGQAAAPSETSGGAVWPVKGAVRDTLGKVFFSLSGRDYVCSATTIASANKDVVVTAGHCAKNGAGTWAENWIFVPGYREDSSPHGGFTARRMFVPDQWSGSSDDDYDVAMVALGTVDGQHAIDVVGAQKIAFDQPRGRQAYVFGYPATGRYDGEQLDYCSGRPHDDPRGLTDSQGLRCDMTQGSSGGAWLSKFNPTTGTGVITSVSSFKYADDGGTMYGPYFGAVVRKLYDQAQHS